MNIKSIYNAITFLIIIFISLSNAQTAERKFEQIKIFEIPEARQGVAVDENYFYAVTNYKIAKYNKTTGEFVDIWEGKEKGPIKHLDSGAIIEGKLYCAHSNYPEFPMTSSIEIWDPETMEHIESHSFGIEYGSCTWIDKYNGYWWAAFAHYNKWSDSTGTDVRWTTLVKFDDQWMKIESWIYPNEVLKKFGEMSNSGGSWGPDGLLYITGHDAPELYVMKIPEQGSILELVDIVPINCTGQGIAWDRSDPGLIFTIRKADHKVIHSKLITE